MRAPTSWRGCCGATRRRSWPWWAASAPDWVRCVRKAGGQAHPWPTGCCLQFGSLSWRRATTSSQPAGSPANLPTGPVFPCCAAHGCWEPCASPTCARRRRLRCFRLGRCLRRCCRSNSRPPCFPDERLLDAERRWRVLNLRGVEILGAPAEELAGSSMPRGRSIFARHILAPVPQCGGAGARQRN